MLLVLTLLAVGTSPTRPPLFGLLSNLTSADEQGATIGVAQSRPAAWRAFSGRCSPRPSMCMSPRCLTSSAAGWLIRPPRPPGNSFTGTARRAVAAGIQPQENGGASVLASRWGIFLLSARRGSRPIKDTSGGSSCFTPISQPNPPPSVHPNRSYRRSGRRPGRRAIRRSASIVAAAGISAAAGPRAACRGNHHPASTGRRRSCPATSARRAHWRFHSHQSRQFAVCVKRLD